MQLAKQSADIIAIHTPSCIWRRTGEIQKANQEFANLTGIPASMFRNGQLCIYELMDEASAVRYWEGYAKIAFDAGTLLLSFSCNDIFFGLNRLTQCSVLTIQGKEASTFPAPSVYPPPLLVCLPDYHTPPLPCSLHPRRPLPVPP